MTPLAILGPAAIAIALAAGWFFRFAIIALAPQKTSRVARTAPLTASFGLFVVLIYIMVVITAPVISPFGESQIIGNAFLPWSATHPLGTDTLGRDMLTRLIYGVRNTVGIAFVATALAFIMGSILGILGATVGGWLDQIVARLVDALMAIPQLIFAFLLLTIFGTSLLSLILIIAVIQAPPVFRVARSVAMNIIVMDFIEAAQLRGERLPRLILREILPNVLPPLVAEFGLRFCFVFLTIASLSFLGLGVQPPSADLGSMVRENAALITYGDITPLLPAAAIALLTLAVNFIVDWILYRTSGLRE